MVKKNKLIEERPILKDLLSELNTDDVVFDIGANVGSYTCFISNQATTHAFEPLPINASRLEENLDLNDRDATIHLQALGDNDGFSKLSMPSTKLPGVGDPSIMSEENEHMETIDVEVTTGDNLVASSKVNHAPTVLKIDVEGAEHDVLMGLRDTLENSCRLVYLELHHEKIPAFGSSGEEVISYLESVGFNITSLQVRSETEFIKGVKEYSR